MSALTPVCCPAGLKSSKRHRFHNRSPFSLGSHRPRGCSCFRLPLNPFAEKGFWRRRRRTASPAMPWRSPCVASGKMSRFGIFLALKRMKALLANARNFENLYLRKEAGVCPRAVHLFGEARQCGLGRLDEAPCPATARQRIFLGLSCSNTIRAKTI